MSQPVKQASRIRLDAKTCLQCSCSGLETKTSSKVLALDLVSLVTLAALGMAARVLLQCSLRELSMLTVQLMIND